MRVVSRLGGQALFLLLAVACSSGAARKTGAGISVARDDLGSKLEAVRAGRIGDVCDIERDTVGGDELLVLGQMALGRFDPDREVLSDPEPVYEIAVPERPIMAVLVEEGPVSVVARYEEGLRGWTSDGAVAWESDLATVGDKVDVLGPPRRPPLFLVSERGAGKRSALVDARGEVLWQAELEPGPVDALLRQGDGEELLYVDGRALWTVQLGRAEPGPPRGHSLGLGGYLNYLAATNSLAKDEGEFVLGLHDGSEQRFFFLDGDLKVAGPVGAEVVDFATAPVVVDSAGGALVFRADEQLIQEQMAGFSDSSLLLRAYDASGALVHESRVDGPSGRAAAGSGGLRVLNEDPPVLLVGYGNHLVRLTL